MKHVFLSGLLTCICLSVFSQAPPQMMNYQTVVRNSLGNPQQAHVTFTFNIHDGSPTGTIIFTETQSAISNSLGLVALQIGSDSNLAVVNWGSGPKYLEVSANVNGNAGPDTTTQLISVPYALYAKTAGNSWQNYASYDERVPSGHYPYTSAFTTLNDATWIVRWLNDSVNQVGSATNLNEGNGAISLSPGTYHVTATAPWGWDIPSGSGGFGYPTATSQLRIRDSTAHITLLVSPSQTTVETMSTLSGSTLHQTYSLQLEGVFTITGNDTIELQQFINWTSLISGPTNYDPGIPINSGEAEVYATLSIQKIN